VEKTTIFIEEKKVTSGMKQQLTSQLSEGNLKDYVIGKGKWTQYTTTQFLKDSQRIDR
jgi:hypothetical protein